MLKSDFGYLKTKKMATNGRICHKNYQELSDMPQELPGIVGYATRITRNCRLCHRNYQELSDMPHELPGIVGYATGITRNCRICHRNYQELSDLSGIVGITRNCRNYQELSELPGPLVISNGKVQGRTVRKI